MKTALVTGHLGFVGRHMKTLLESRGWLVHGIDIKHPSGVDARRFFMDYANRKDQQYDLLVHCAAVVGGKEKIDNSPFDLACDLTLDAEAFQWAKRMNCKMVYLSSSAAYPSRLQTEAKIALSTAMNGDQAAEEICKLGEKNINLKSVEQPDAFYGWSKLTGEILADIASKDGLDVLVVRPFSGYGGDQDLTYPFPSLLRRAINKENPFVVWGSGNQTRDWIHIDDFVKAIYTLVEANVNEAVNISTGVGTKFTDLINMMWTVAGNEGQPTIKCDKSKPEGVFYRVGDNTKLKQWYEPQITIEQGIEMEIGKLKNKC